MLPKSVFLKKKIFYKNPPDLIVYCLCNLIWMLYLRLNKESVLSCHFIWPQIRPNQSRSKISGIFDYIQLQRQKTLLIWTQKWNQDCSIRILIDKIWNFLVFIWQHLQKFRRHLLGTFFSVNHHFQAKASG